MSLLFFDLGENVGDFLGCNEDFCIFAEKYTNLQKKE